MNKAIEALLERYDYTEKQTMGNFFALDKKKHVVYSCDTLELPWKENQTNISCIPEGKYVVRARQSAKFGKHFHITGVEGRSYILIHKGNFYTSIRGCVLVGTDLSDINNDGYIDVINSGTAMAKLLELMPDEFNLTVTKQ